MDKALTGAISRMAINQTSYNAIQPELTSGEMILWAGQPSTEVILRKEDVFMVPFSLFFAGFSVFWELGVAGFWGSGSAEHKEWIFGIFWGIPFILAGQYLLWGRFLVAAWKKRRTFYAVTNRRVIAVQHVRGRKMASAYIDTLPTITKQGERKSLGTLLFAQQQPLWFRTAGWGGWGAWDGMSIGDVPEFRDIEDVNLVYRLVADQRDSLRRAAF